jgi:hypothetical protein
MARKRRRPRFSFAYLSGLCLLLLLVGGPFAPGHVAWPASLEVGPGKPYARIEEANARARPGDVILVHPRENGMPYEQTAVFVRQPDLTFRAVPGRNGRRVTISGKGFEYSGSGNVPRAIFQFNPGTDRCTLEGFELTGAHNRSHNGAGVRTIRCSSIRPGTIITSHRRHLR